MKKICLLTTIILLLFVTSACSSNEVLDKYSELFENEIHGVRDNIFIYSEEDTQRIENRMQKVESYIEKDSNVLLISMNFSLFFNELLYVQEQFVIINAYSMMFPDNDEINDDLVTLKSFLLEMDSKRFDYLISLTKSKYRDSFFPDWETTDYSFITNREELYDSEYYDLEQQLVVIENEYSNLLNETTLDFDDLASKCVEKIEVENKIANKLGYDNYVDYMYETMLSREYEYNDLVNLRNDSLNIASTIIDVRAYVSDIEFSDTELLDYNRLANGSFFESKNELDKLAEYMGGEYLDNYNFFWDKGEYYFGNDNSYDAAYIQKTVSQNFTLAYFGPGYYSSLHTVTHEIGHYSAALEDYSDDSYDNIDLCEFQAQANEMLLTSYMYNNNLDNRAYEVLALTELTGGLSTVLMGLIVSDFEYEVYTKENLIASDLSIIMSNIYDFYNVSDLFRDSDEMWALSSRYPTGYYISYGISIIPSMELFFVAIDNFDDAKLDYINIMKGENEILPTIEIINYNNPLTTNILSELITKIEKLK